MPDITSLDIEQQRQLLREIRDELRGARAEAGGAPGASVSPSAISHRQVASSSFSRTQQLSDHVMAGQWTGQTWRQAFQPYYQSSMPTDIVGAMGFMRAPQGLTQPEFQAVAWQSLATRPARMIGNLIVPRTTEAINQLSEDFLANSSRFLRTGDMSTGPLGVGAGYLQSRAIARETQRSAALDMRLSMTDYAQIQRTGFQTGQFDLSRGVGGFQERFRELTTAVGELSRVMRSSPGEIAQSLGSLRNLGVYSISQQAGLLRGTEAAARVAGLTTGEMMQTVGSIAQAGLQQGLGAQMTIPLAAGIARDVREMSRQNILSPHLMAVGGGTAGITQAIAGAQTGFMGTDMAYAAALGQAPGRDFLGAAIRGIGTMATPAAYARAMANRIDVMGNLGPERAAELNRGRFATQLGLMGISDQTSEEAQNMVFMMARGEMGEAGALTFARQQFSRQGRRAAFGARVSSRREEEAMGARLEQDTYWMHNSLSGRIQMARQRMADLASGTMQGIESMVTPSAGTRFLGMESEYGMSRRALETGARVDASAMGRILETGITGGSLRDRPARAYELVSRSAQSTSDISAAALTVGGALIPVPGGPFLGTLGRMGLAFGGVKLGSALGDPTTRQEVGGYEGRRIMDVMEAFRAPGAAVSDRAQALLTGQAISKNGVLPYDPRFMKLLTAKFTDSPDDTRNLTADVGQLGRDYGLSTGEVVGMLKAHGVNPQFADLNAKVGDQTSKEVAEKFVQGGETSKLNYAEAAPSAELGKYITAIASNDRVAELSARRELVSLNESGAILDAFREKARSDPAAARRAGEALIATGEASTQRELSRELRSASGVMADFVMASDSKTKGDYLELIKGAKTPQELLRLFDPRNRESRVRGLQELLKKGDPLFQDVLDVDATKLLAMPAEKLGQMLGIEDTRRVSSFQAQWQGRIGKDEATKGDMEATVRAFMLTQRGGGSEMKARSDEVTVATNLAMASEILERLTNKKGKEG